MIILEQSSASMSWTWLLHIWESLFHKVWSRQKPSLHVQTPNGMVSYTSIISKWLIEIIIYSFLRRMQRRGSQGDSLHGKRGKITAHYRDTLQDNLPLSLGRVVVNSKKQPAPYSDQ